MKVLECMTTQPITIESNHLASEALSLLKTHHLHVLPVLQEGRLKGIIKLEDLQAYAERKYGEAMHARERDHELLHSMYVEDAMRSATTSVMPEDSLQIVAQEMLRHNILGLPVVDEKHHLVGVVTISDVLGALSREHEQKMDLNA